MAALLLPGECQHFSLWRETAWTQTPTQTLAFPSRGNVVWIYRWPAPPLSDFKTDITDLTKEANSCWWHSDGQAGALLMPPLLINTHTCTSIKHEGYNLTHTHNDNFGQSSITWSSWLIPAHLPIIYIKSVASSHLSTRDHNVYFAFWSYFT